MPRRTRLLLGLAAVGIAGVLAYVYGWRGPARHVPGAEAYTVVANLDDFFDPQVLRVAVGTEVEFESRGQNPHTVTADDGSFDSGTLVHGDEFSHRFDRPGVYAFTCILHGKAGGIGMTGVVVVGDVPLPSKPGAAFGVGPGRETAPTGTGATIRVPADEPTIQAAVNASAPGDLVLVAPGEYHESVLVRTPFLTIRGEDRNTTILDGELKRPNGIAVIEADGVAIENLTARHYALNGFYWRDVFGYRGSYLTAYANGDYGVYAFGSRYGRFEHSYASGHPDSGFYIGQCKPCYAVIDDVESAENGLGYSGTNAGGDLAIVNSRWHDNMAGLVPNTLDSEGLAPQAGALIKWNRVYGNNRLDVPAKHYPYAVWGIGIVIAGGRDNEVRENVVVDHATYGIAVMPIIDEQFWTSGGNTVRDNSVSHSGVADLAFGGPGGGRDCFIGNQHDTSMPPGLESVMGCGVPFGRLGGGGLDVTIGSLLTRYIETFDDSYPHGDWKTWPAPKGQTQMPDALTAGATPAVPETAVPGAYVQLNRDNEAILLDPQPREVTIMAIPLDNTPWGLVLGLYGYVFPLVLLAVWISIALWDLTRREDLTSRRRLTWIAVVLVVPFLGPVLYFALGRTAIPRSTWLMLVVGGLVVYLGLAAAAALLAAG
ncbi:MAG TPA: PLDc N-terminal domain-containing protein [Candidatus Polarisedimenticolia bacterium]|nr:PLDc N-terminal domain-containing protein [Candidatus Polarisedimenticolia bacterium]